MYLGTFYFILTTFIATLHCYDPDNELTNFGTAAKNFNEAVSTMSDANIIKKTSLLDSGKLRLVANKLKGLLQAAGPLAIVISIVFSEDVEYKRYVILRLRIQGLKRRLFFRHKEIMNEFKKLNDRFDRVELKLDEQTRLLILVIQQAHLTNFLAPIKATNGIYDAFVLKNSSFHFHELKNRYHSIIDNIVGLELNIGQYFEKFMDVHGNFGALFDIYTNIAGMLTKLKLAFGVSCLQRCRTNNHTDSHCTSSCFEDDPM